MRKGLTAILILGVLALSGCGQSGALYMPKDAAQSSTHEQAQ